jgi:hypothetical protein
MAIGAICGNWITDFDFNAIPRSQETPGGSYPGRTEDD